MAESMGGLEFEVLASGADEAAASLGRLANTLNKLRSASSGIAQSTSAIASLSSSLEQLGKFRISGDVTRSLSSLSTMLNRLNSIRIDSSMTNSVNELVLSLEGFNTINTRQIGSIATAMRRLSDALGSMRSPEMFDQFMISLQADLSMITADQMEMLAQLTDALRGIASVSGRRLTLGTGLSELVTSMGSLTDEMLDRLQRLADILQHIPPGARIPRIPNVGNNGGVNGNNGGANQGDLDGRADRVADSARRASQAQERLSQTSRAASASMGLLTNAGNLAKAALSGVGSVTATIGKGIGSVLTRPITQFSEGVSGAVGKVGQFVRSLGRILLYRAIRSMLSGITSALREGIKNLYAYSSAMGGAFASSMDTISSCLLTLKNSMAAAVSPLVNALAPAFETVTNYIVTAANALGKFLAMLTGQGFYVRATAAAKKFGDAASSSGSKSSDAAKKSAADAKAAGDAWENFLMDFDEINKIPDQSGGSGGKDKSPSDGGSGGSGGSGGPDYGSMFETVEISESEVADWITTIREAFLDGDWETLGTTIGEKINEAVDMVPWEDIGSKLGYGINGAIQTMYYILETIDFFHIGEQVSVMLNAALEQIDFEILGRLLVRKMTLAVDFFLGALTTLDWALVGKSIKDLFMGQFSELSEWMLGYDWASLGNTLSTGLTDAVTSIDIGALVSKLADTISIMGESFDAFIRGFNWKSLGTSIADGIMNALETTDWRRIASGVTSSLAGIVKALGDLVDSIDWVRLAKDLYEGIKSLFSGMKIGGIVQAINSLFGKITGALGLAILTVCAGIIRDIRDYFEEKMKENGGSIIKTLLSALSEGWSNIGRWVWTNLAKPFIDAVGEKFGIKDLSGKVAGLGKKIGDGIVNGIGSVFTDIKNWIDNNILSLFDTSIDELSDRLVGIGSAIGNWILDGIKAIFGVDWITDNVIDPLVAKVKELTGIDISGGTDKASGGTKTIGPKVQSSGGGSAWQQTAGAKIVSATVALDMQSATDVTKKLNKLLADRVVEGEPELEKKSVSKFKEALEALTKNRTVSVETSTTVSDTTTSKTHRKIVSGLASTASVGLKLETNALSNMKSKIQAVTPTITAKLKAPVLSYPPIQLSTGQATTIKPTSTTYSTFATGGIIDKPTLAMMGEMGRKEAVVPLERSEWTDALAEKIIAGMGGDMAESVAAGMELATAEQNALLRQQNTLLQRMLDKDLVATIGVGDVTSALRRQNKRMGRTVVTVG